jgi:hypothetical protein
MKNLDGWVSRHFEKIGQGKITRGKGKITTEQPVKAFRKAKCIASPDV